MTETSTNFGHWICERDKWTHSRILVDGGEVACVEANDVEGWAIIDLLIDPENPHFASRAGQAKVFGDVEIQLGDNLEGGLVKLFNHQMILLDKPSTLWRPRWQPMPRKDGKVFLDFPEIT